MIFFRINISCFHSSSNQLSNFWHISAPSSTPESAPPNNIPPRHFFYPSCLPLSSCPLLLSSPSLSPASSQLCILTSHLAHSWGKSLSKAMDACYTDPSPDVACLHREVGLILCLSPCICQLLLHASEKSEKLNRCLGRPGGGMTESVSKPQANWLSRHCA